MLFRRPFAFLIKYFKMIHLTLTVMIVYLLLKTNSIFRFIGEYMNSNMSTIGADTISSLFTPMMLVIIVAILVLTFIILCLMSYKKKPIQFYIFNVLVYGFVTFVFVFAYSNIKTLEIGLLDIRTLKLIQDFSLFALILQSLSLIAVAIRATGFDIKKFDFDQDVADLKITAEDSEEFEVDVELDTDQLKRTIRKKLRHIKYIYIENKFIINIIVLLCIALVCGVIYLNVGVYHKLHSENEPFKTTEFMLNIKKSYITNTDYHNNTITEDKKLLVIQYEVRNITAVNKKQFKPERFTLTINGKTLHAVDTYKDELYDLGAPYHYQYLTTNFQLYTLTYEISKDVKLDKIVLNYYDTNDQTIGIQITPVDDTKKTLIASTNMMNELSFDKTVLKNSRLKIDLYEIQNTFTNFYTYCISGDNCFTGMEYIQPSISGNFDKTLLKLTGKFMLDEASLLPLSDLYSILRDFGSIIYEINGEEKVISSNFKLVKPTKPSTDNVYYIEVPKELEIATKIKIRFTFREFVYEFIVK